MKVIPACLFSATIIAVLSVTMCSNTGSTPKPGSSNTYQTPDSSSLKALQHHIDSLTGIIYEYDGLWVRAARLQKTIDSNANVLKDVMVKLAEARNFNLRSVYSGDTSRIAINKAMEELEIIFRKVIMLSGEKDSALARETRLVQEKNIILQKISSREETMKKISDLMNSLAGKIEGRLDLLFAGKKFEVFIASAKKHEVIIHSNSRGPYTFSRFGEFIQKDFKTTPEMITNGGMFTTGYDPQGLLISGGKIAAPIDSSVEKKDGNFYMYPNGVFSSDPQFGFQIQETSEFLKQYTDEKKMPMFATQSGPMLVHRGRIHPSFTPGSTNVYVRSGAGLMAKDRVVFIISDQVVNFYDIAMLYRYIFNCQEALYLDGAISKMYFTTDKTMPEGQFGPMIAVVKKK